MANYTMRADGTAANLAACEDGDPTVVSECMSVATHNGLGLGLRPAAGDHVMIADTGGVYRSTLNPWGGSGGTHLFYEAYSGDTPVFSGSDIIVTWTVYSGSVYQATVTTEPEQIWVDGTFGDRQVSTGACVNEYDWYWASNVLYLYAPADPDTEYTAVEAGQRDRCIDWDSGDYVTLDGLTAQHGNTHNIMCYNSNYVTMKNCISEWAWLIGITNGGSINLTDGLIEDCIVRYCGETGLGSAFPGSATMTNYSFIRNTAHECGKFQYAATPWNYDHTWTAGIKLWTSQNICTNVVVAENVCYDNGPTEEAGPTSQAGNGIWMDEINGSSGAPLEVKHNLSYNNAGSGIFIEISNYNDVYGNVCYNNTRARNLNDYSMAGICVLARAEHTCNNNNVYNNTVVGGYIGLHVTSYEQSEGCDISDNTIKNNIVINASARNLRADNGGDNAGSWGSGNVYSHNCFDAEASDFIQWDGTDYGTYDAWIAASSTSDTNIEADPSFTDEGGDDYTLASDSPCIGSGDDLGSPYGDCLMPTSSWPDAVVTGNQDDY